MTLMKFPLFGSLIRLLKPPLCTEFLRKKSVSVLSYLVEIGTLDHISTRAFAWSIANP